jgi:hypothetical protein
MSLNGALSVFAKDEYLESYIVTNWFEKLFVSSAFTTLSVSPELIDSPPILILLKVLKLLSGTGNFY